MDLSHIFSGAVKGFVYVKNTIDIAVRGFHEGNATMEQDALHVLNVWSQEFTKMEATGGIELVFDHDPFSGSRKLAQDLKVKYPK